MTSDSAKWCPVHNTTPTINGLRLVSPEDVRFAQLVSDNTRLRIFVENIRDNFDCDADGHRYKTYCRACEAKELLATLSTSNQKGQP